LNRDARPDLYFYRSTSACGEVARSLCALPPRQLNWPGLTAKKITNR